jgi:hypothetical protein
MGRYSALPRTDTLLVAWGAPEFEPGPSVTERGHLWKRYQPGYVAGPSMARGEVSLGVLSDAAFVPVAAERHHRPRVRPQELVLCRLPVDRA